MKWFKRWFANKCREAWEEARNEREQDCMPSVKTARLVGGSTNDIETERGLSIQVQPAIGGRIVSFRHYDHKTDRHYNKTYVIPEDQDFERELGKMITLESMR